MTMSFAHASMSASGFGLQSSSQTTCNSSFEVGGELPYRINGTYICGVNPFTSRAALEKCCQGPITNITSPAPTSGPLSDSWPVTCMAYCPIMLHPKYDGVTDNEAHDKFIDCLTDENAFHNVVCTEVDGYAPNECIPFSQSVGCTDGLTHSTWDGSTYVSGAVLATPTPSGTTSGTVLRITSAPATTTPATTTTASSNATGPPSLSSTKSGAQQIKHMNLSTIIAVTFVLQALVFPPLVL
ncbi:hypothetical protein F5884DRAFT_442078 [Xylogone sp. PMI_703]|nr:hypothetical protein F5884DRAFT_442078 [Xylogone sp. PMI_703]